MIACMGQRKITINVPADLLARAQKSSGQSITETIPQGLRLGALGETFPQVGKLRGTVKFSVDLARLREDRA